MQGNAFNLVDLVKGNLTDTFINRLSSYLGETGDKTQAGLHAAVPGLLSGLDSAASTSEGSRRIANAIDDADDGILDTFTGPFNKDFPMESHLGSIRSIMGGGGLSDLTRNIERSSGLSGKSVSTLIGFLIPIVLGVLKRVMRSRGLKFTDIPNLLANQRANIMAAMPAGMAADAYREPLRDVTDEAYTTSRATSPSKTQAPVGWLVPLAAIAGALGLVWYLASRPASQAGREERTVAERTTTPDESTYKGPASMMMRTKYDSVFRVAQEQGVQFSDVHQEGRTLMIVGTAPSLEAANKVWDEIKRVNPRLDDIVANFAVMPSAETP